jgi:hypothetical protein
MLLKLCGGIRLMLAAGNHTGGVTIASKQGVPVFNRDIFLGVNDPPHGEKRETGGNLQ